MSDPNLRGLMVDDLQRGRRPLGSLGGVAEYATDSNGNTVLVGADGETLSVVSNSHNLTVGAGGKYVTLDDALTARDAIAHTLLASTTISTELTYTAGQDVRQVLFTAIAAGIVSVKGDVGVRIGGAGNPILRCTLISTGRLTLHAPIAATFAVGTAIDIYQIKHVGICITPGTYLSLGNSATRIIPAYTTIYCPVQYGATLAHDPGSAGDCFIADGSQNNIYFKNLVLHDVLAGINSTFWKIPAATATNSQPLCDYGIFDCEIQSTSQDFIYGSGSNAGPCGAMHLHRNKISGTYDIVNSVIWRHLDVQDNIIEMVSRGDFKDDAGADATAGDGGQPTAIVLGGGSTTTYPEIITTVKNNKIRCYGIPHGGGYGVQAVAVQIRTAIPSQSVVDVDNNHISCNKRGGTSTFNVPAAVLVSATVSGTNTPSITARNNTIDVQCTNSAAGTAYSLHSANATYVIKRSGNRVVNGTLGSNTDATGFI